MVSTRVGDTPTIIDGPPIGPDPPKSKFHQFVLVAGTHSVPRGGKNYFWVCLRGANGYHFLKLWLISDHLQKKLTEELSLTKFGGPSKSATSPKIFGKYSGFTENRSFCQKITMAGSLSENCNLYPIGFCLGFYHKSYCT